MTEQESTPAQALHEIQEILLLAALDEPLLRQVATRYTFCRELLLRTDLRTSLPGFLQQCLTVYRFRDFIHLYHASAEARVGFIDEALHSAANRVRRKQTPPSFQDAFSASS